MSTSSGARPITLLCVLALASVAALPPPESSRRLDSEAARTVVRFLEASDFSGAATALAYPPDFTKDQLASDQLGVANAIRLLLAEFGALSSVRISERHLQFYEVGVAGGPRPFWWQTPEAPSRTFYYIYEVQFSKFGPGVLKILTFDSPSGEVPVSINFGFLPSVPEADQRVRRAFNGLLDMMGVPGDHPARSMPVPISDSPPASLP